MFLSVVSDKHAQTAPGELVMIREGDLAEIPRPPQLLAR